MQKKILVTGGSGYIGSHTLIELLPFYEVVVVDNLSNSSKESLNRVEHISAQKIEFVEGDICDPAFLKDLFAQNQFNAVIHFAGLKAVGESVSLPLKYYENNVVSTVNLLNAMNQAGVKNLVFSSSATVYGVPDVLPLTENMPRSATNPYGQTKLMIEYILMDLAHSDSDWNVVNLRYFNPVGAHKSGLIGEDPQGMPNNLMPFISQVAVGAREALSIFGSDYDTVDGTGVRDYIHVVDLAKGHLAALDYLFAKGLIGFEAFNLGTGNGISVLEMVRAFEQFNDVEVPYKLIERRPGDVAACYADASKANQQLNWQAELGLKEMCIDTWRWQSNNPNGYK
jgi:UDP-glucose 4-epimerase